MNRLKIIIYNFYGDVVFWINFATIVITLNTLVQGLPQLCIGLNIITIIICVFFSAKHKKPTLCDIYTFFIAVLSQLFWFAYWWSRFMPNINVNNLGTTCRFFEIILRLFFVIRMAIYLKNKKMDIP